MRRRALAGLAIVLGCTDPLANLGDGAYRCASGRDEDCPPGFRCVEQVCRQNGAASNGSSSSSSASSSASSSSSGGGGAMPCTMFPDCQIEEIVAGTAHTCARRQNGDVFCWGDNRKGQIGSDCLDDDACAFPTKVTNLGEEPPTQLAAGGDHTCAIVDGGVLCWGDDSSQPTPMTLPSGNVLRVAAGASHTCAQVQGDGVYCWGANADGQLGSGMSGPPETSAVRVDLPVSGSGGGGGAAPYDLQALAAGARHSCAVTPFGLVYCWGSDDSGQLGDGGAASAPGVPVLVLGSGDAPNADLVFSLGSLHSCAHEFPAQVWCWGENASQQLGVGGADATAPIMAPQASCTRTVPAIGTGSEHTCIACSEQTTTCWGNNAEYQLGLPDATTYPPTEVDPLFETTVLGAGAYHTCAAQGTDLRCTGRNDHGQLGNGTVGDPAPPVDVVLPAP